MQRKCSANRKHCVLHAACVNFHICEAPHICMHVLKISSCIFVLFVARLGISDVCVCVSDGLRNKLCLKQGIVQLSRGG